MGSEKNSKEVITRRLAQILNYSGSKKGNVEEAVERISREYGVPLSKYEGVQTREEIVEITFKNQKVPSPLEIELNAEYLYIPSERIPFKPMIDASNVMSNL